MLYTLHRHVLLPLFETGLKRRRTLRHWAELERSQWLDRERLERMQVEALNRLLTHAYQWCPYYRGVLGEGPRRGRGLWVESLDDLQRLPVMDRETVRARRAEMRSTAPGMRLMSKSTGGSSGVPLQFDLNHDSHDRRMAAAHRGYAWAGAGPGTRQVHLWGMPLEQARWRRWKERLHHRFNRWEVLNCFEFSDDRAGEFAERLERCRPEVIVAYTNPLYVFARALEAAGRRPWSPRAIVAGAEKLHDFQRETIERVFRAPVFETYGSREFMLIGAECERHEGLHLTAEHLLVEVLDDDGGPTAAGEEGNVVITDLYNYGMPFIRYANGDRAVAGWEQCSCGRGLPLLRKVMGRRLDVLHTPDGRRIAGEFFPRLMRDVAWMKRFQVVQERVDRVEMRVVVDELRVASCELRERQMGRLKRAVQERLGPLVKFEIVEVDAIPLTRSGKLQVVVSRVNEQWVNDAHSGIDESVSESRAA